MIVAAGWNHEVQELSGGRRYFIGMTEVAPQGISAEDGWQYADFLIEHERAESQAHDEGTALPSIRRGLSGGAIWHLWRKDGSDEVLSRTLRGVAFREISRDEEHAIHVRAHCDLSILRLLHQAGVVPPDTSSFGTLAIS